MSCEAHAVSADILCHEYYETYNNNFESCAAVIFHLCTFRACEFFLLKIFCPFQAHIFIISIV